MAKDKNITLPPDFFPAEKSYGSSLQMNPHLSGNVDYDLIRKKTEEIYPQIVAYRRKIHQNPELSGEEVQTSQFVLKSLEEMGIPCRRIAGNGVIATIIGTGKKNMTLAIRADMDALPITEDTGLPYASRTPGVMHACGHDMHTAILLGTASILNSMKKNIPGNIKLLFQPAEETTGGAAAMINEGCLESPRVDAVLGLHVSETVPLGNIELRHGVMNAATSEFQLKIIGKSCHGAHPEGGIDAIVIAGSIISTLQTIVTRNLDPTEPLIITVGKIQGGTKENVIAGEVTMSGTLRSLDFEHRDFAKKRMIAICNGIASAYGGRCEITFDDNYPPLVNDSRLITLMSKIGDKLIGPEHVSFRPSPSLGADDFAFFCQEVPSVYFNIGCTDFEKGTPAPAHNEKFNPEEEAMKYGVMMEVLGVLEMMEGR